MNANKNMHTVFVGWNESVLNQYYIDKVFIDNTILFQNPTDYNKKYEEERWKIRFEVSFNLNILKIRILHQYKEFHSRSGSKHFLL